MNKNIFARVFPFLRWREQVNKTTLRQDVLAGATGAVIAIPQCVAFATIAGMPPEYGLYTGMVPAIIAALFGSSWHLVSGPTTAASIVLFSILSSHGEPGSASYIQQAITMTFLVGLFQLAMGVFRLGIVIQFVSHSVVLGFTAGAALLIATNQLHHFTGLPIPQGSTFAQTIHTALRQWSAVDLYTLGVAMATLLLGVAVRFWWPKTPYMLFALLGGTGMAALLQHLNPSVAASISLVGTLPTALPPLSMPDWSLANFRQLLSPALAVTLLALTEAVSIARAIAARTGQHIDGNQEFIGQGLSNMVGSFFSAYVATGSFNRSGINHASGAQTPLAAVFGGLFLALFTPLTAPVMAFLPNAAMAGVLFIVAWGLVDFKQITHILHTSAAESTILAATFLATLFLGLEGAILLGALLSLLVYLQRTSHPRVVVRTPDAHHPRRAFSSDSHLPLCPQLRIIRIDGSLYYGAIQHVQQALQRLATTQPHQKHVMIIASGINFIDHSGAEFLAEESLRCRKRGGDLYLVRVKQPVLAVLERTGQLAILGRDHLYGSKAQAIDHITRLLDRHRCQLCQNRIFRECQPQEQLPAPLTEKQEILAMDATLLPGKLVSILEKE